MIKWLVRSYSGLWHCPEWRPALPWTQNGHGCGADSREALEPGNEILRLAAAIPLPGSPGQPELENRPTRIFS